MLDPGRKGIGSGLVAGEGLPVGPLGCERPVEALDFPVLPGAVRLDELLLRAERSDGVLERGRVSVGERVVRDHSFDSRDAVAGEVGRCASQEPCCGRPLLVRVDLRVGKTAMVIDRCVDVDLALLHDHLRDGVTTIRTLARVAHRSHNHVRWALQEHPASTGRPISPIDWNAELPCVRSEPWRRVGNEATDGPRTKLERPNSVVWERTPESRVEPPRATGGNAG